MVRRAFINQQRTKDRKLRAWKPTSMTPCRVVGLKRLIFAWAAWAAQESRMVWEKYDSSWSVPYLLDVFEPFQRKALHTCFEEKTKAQIKVPQLARYILEHSAY